MARNEQDEAPRRDGLKEAWGVVLFAVCILLSLSLFSYDWKDIGVLRAPANQPPTNFVGPVGAWLGFLLFSACGVLAYVVPLACLVGGLLLLLAHPAASKTRLFCLVLLAVCVAGLMELRPGWWVFLTARLNMSHAPAGFPGHVLAHRVFIRYLGEVGTLVLSLSGMAISLILLFGREAIAAVLVRAWRAVAGRREPVEAGVAAESGPGAGGAEAAGYTRVAPRYGDAVLPESRSRGTRRTERPPATVAEPPRKPEPGAEPEPEEEPGPEPAEAAEPEVPAAPEPAAPAAERKLPRPKPVSRSASSVAPLAAADQAGQAYANYQLPPVSLLEPLASGKDRTLQSDIGTTSRIIVETLAEFGIETQVSNVERGPVVTRYELLPAPGVRVERIAGLSNNLALSLKAQSVRVQAPIPGKGVVGVEVPNSTATMVYLRELLEGDAWRQSKAQLPLVLGKDVGGSDIVVDLATMPHMLIAGATGSGKTVCMNSILAGLLMSRTPAELNLMLIDPKIVEFSGYNRLPHLVGVRKEVITDSKKVAGGLRWAISEMERRYKVFAKAGVRNIQAYNSRPIPRQQDLFGAAAPAKDFLPYIVIIVDELADLMMTAQAEVEGYIARLAQLSRAVGIHMILATQRPSVNVITGTIKANFPARIAFQVAQKVDSRTILDANGADKLLGRGDMLFLPPGSAKLVRAQGCMTTDEDIRRIVDFIRKQAPMPPPPEEDGGEDADDAGADGPPDGAAAAEAGPTPAPTAVPTAAQQAPPPAAAGASMSFDEMLDNGDGGDEDTKLIEAAMQIIRETRRASTSSLQRRLRIGYTRAARIMDTLEERGIVGPARGADPREILIDLDGAMPDASTEGEA